MAQKALKYAKSGEVHLKHFLQIWVNHKMVTVSTELIIKKDTLKIIVDGQQFMNKQRINKEIYDLQLTEIPIVLQSGAEFTNQITNLHYQE